MKKIAKKVSRKTAPKKTVTKKDRDIEKGYSRKEFVEKLLRFAEAIYENKAFEIQIAGERIKVPKSAKFTIEHEREKGSQEVEFQIKWKS